MTDTTNPQAAWPSAVRDAFWTAVNAPTYDESTAATLAFAQLLTALAAASVPASAPTDPRQPAYDAVFAYIREQPRDFVPTTVVDRNAMIWHAVHAALDAVGVPGPASADRASLLALVDKLIERCPDHGCVEPEWEDGCHCEIVPLLRRLADAVPVSGPGGAADETQAPCCPRCIHDERTRAVLQPSAMELYPPDHDPGCPQAEQPEPVPPVDRCIHVKAIHDTHHHTPVTGCPWCATAEQAAGDPS